MQHERVTPSDVVRLPVSPETLARPDVGESPASFAPLLERAPEVLSQSIRQIFEAVAVRVEEAAESDVRLAIERQAAAAELAAGLRALGEQRASQAAADAEVAKAVAADMKRARQLIDGVRLPDAAQVVLPS